MKKLTLLFIMIIGYVALNAQINGAIISNTNNVKLIKIWGTHHERGYAYGSLLGDEITDVFNNYLQPQFGTYYPFARNIIIAEEDLKFDSLFIIEAKAIVEGMNDAGLNTTNMDYVDMLVCNSFLDISKLLSKSMGMGCSSLISWGDATAGTDLDGKSVISRHLDWSINSYLTNNQIMCVSLPSETDEQPWLNIGFAGMFSVLSGFNANVGVFQHMMDDFSGSSQHNKQYEPIWFSLRSSIEKLDYNQDGFNNVQDVRSKLMDQSSGSADGFIISAVAKSTESHDSLIALIAEIAPASPNLIFRYNSYPDSIPGENVYTANYQIARNNLMHFCSRYNSIVDAIEEGTNIGTIESWDMMRDYSHLNHNLQFMQYAPELDLFKIAVYNNGLPAYTQDPISFSIIELFGAYVDIENTQDSDVSVKHYPNPVKDILTVSGINSEKGDVDITVYNNFGKIVDVKSYNNSPSESKLQFDALPAGIYLVKINTKKNTTLLKVVKQ